MSALDYLARAGGAVASFRDAFLSELDVSSHEESLRAAARRCQAERLPVRRVMWAGGSRGKRPWEREWLDGRFLARSAAGDLVISTVFPEDAASYENALGWWMAMTRAFGVLVEEAGASREPARSVRFVLAQESGRSRGRPVVPTGWPGFGRYQEIEVRAGDGFVALHAGGFAGVLLAYFASQAGGNELSWGPPIGSAVVRVAGELKETLAAEVLLASALWWRFAGFSDVIAILSWLSRVAPGVFWQAVTSRLEASGLTWEALSSHELEARLGALHTLAAALGNDADAEEEAAGWCREVEAAIAMARPEPRMQQRERVRALTSPSWPKERPGFASKLDASRPYIGAPGFADPGAWKALFGWSRWTCGRLLALADGERSLAEIALRLMIEFGIDWEAAVGAVSGAVREGRLVPMERRALTSRTLLYFSYGSCMCRPSFRETVPRFELIGEAALKGFRIAFTHRSVVRAGGVADVVPDEGSEVRGILYRISRADLADLDEREGVRTGRYKREWVDVEALGVRYPNVLTYTVVNKHSENIPPSAEYAGLICEGAKGMLDAGYVEALEALFSQLGVEPELP